MVLVVLCITCLLAVAWFSGLPALAYFQSVVMVRGAVTGPMLSLGEYEAKIEAREIEGLSRDTSGLTYSSHTGTLFAVSNRPPRIAELTTDGHLLRMISLDGVKDPEGLTHVEGDRFIVLSEGDQSLYWMTIGAQATHITAEGEDRLRLDAGGVRNLGFEGISWDSRGNQLFIAQEMFPARVLLVKGFGSDVGGKRLDVREWKPNGLAGAFMLDLSSATLHEATGNLILLSHMSRILVEYAPDGAVLSSLPLWRGMHGLAASIAQAEGVAVGPDGDVFIVSEPNLFYRFGKVEPDNSGLRP